MPQRKVPLQGLGKGVTSMVTVLKGYPVGSLVHYRRRDWIVTGREGDRLYLRPLQGREEESCVAYLPLAGSQLMPAEFPAIGPDTPFGDFEQGRLLRDAARMALRNAVGPFRSFGSLSVEPRPYQLVPLVMALRLDPVRLLIADDVGIGKTVEAGLIAKELLERGLARRVAVLAPPQLCDQWQRELEQKFHIAAEMVRSSTWRQLQRRLPGLQSIYEYYPHLVISIDFVKQPEHRQAFLNHCPDLVIVDEAHGAADLDRQQSGQQLRHRLVREIAEDSSRHLLLLTATPHNGLGTAFASLISLLDPELGRAVQSEPIPEPVRARLARHFVQRRRADVQAWLGTTTPFPRRESAEAPYQLSPAYRQLYEGVWALTRESMRGKDVGEPQRRMRYWAALALLRSVMSSPAAAAEALARREAGAAAEASDGGLSEDPSWTALQQQQVMDATLGEEAPDTVPYDTIAMGVESLPHGLQSRLHDLRLQAEAIRDRGGDTKLESLIQQVRKLLEDHYHPIVFCRFVDTAGYVARHLEHRLAPQFSGLQVLTVTGDMPDEERLTRVQELAAAKRRVLVATDCLSEGIDLQQAFDAVIHYDLPWNPNRLEQREGRVDRYGQPRDVVRTLLLYGSDNVIDRAVLRVLIRKAQTIYRDLGVMVPVPIDSDTLLETLVRYLLEEDPGRIQMRFDWAEAEIHPRWEQAAQAEKVSRTRYAQHAIKPGEIEEFLRQSQDVLATPADVERLVTAAAARLGSQLHLEVQPASTPRVYAVRQPELLESMPHSRGRRSEVLVGFGDGLPPDVISMDRNHPWVVRLAQRVLGEAFRPGGQIGRVMVTVTPDVTRLALVVLARLRYRIAEREHWGYGEEVAVTRWQRRPDGHQDWEEWNAPGLVTWWTQLHPGATPSPQERAEQRDWALELLARSRTELEDLGRRRAQVWEEGYRRLRQAARGLGPPARIEPFAPDVLALYVLLPGGTRG